TARAHGASDASRFTAPTRRRVGIRPINTCCSGRSIAREPAHPRRPSPLSSRRYVMRVALYARVSTSRQAQAQTIEQQLERVQEQVHAPGETVAKQEVFRDAGYSGASLSRPGLDQLRDRVALAEFDRVVVTAPDRLARKYVHQVLLIEELQSHGCTVEF